MADLGFLPAVTRLLDLTPAGGQRMLFSATLDRGVDKLVDRYLTNPALHAVPEAVDSTPAEHSLLVAPRGGQAAGHGRDRRPPGPHAALRPDQARRRPAGQAAVHGPASTPRHPRQPQPEPAAARARRLRRRHPRVLVATDVAARGIHVDDVDLVVHFDPPEDHKDYLHRSGRTARAGASGQVVALAERRAAPRAAADARSSRNHRRQPRRHPRAPRAARVRYLRHPGAAGPAARPADTPPAGRSRAGAAAARRGPGAARSGAPAGRTASPRRQPRRPVRQG